MIDQRDQDLYDNVGSAFAEVRLDRDADDVIRRGRTLRRRRRAMPALAAAGVLAFSLSVAAVTALSHSPSSSAAVVNVDEAAFSVHTDAKTGVVTVTIRELFNEDQLKQLLAEAGIPAVFGQSRYSASAKAISPCMWIGVSNLDLGNVLVHPESSNGNVFEIHRNAMPPGSVLGFAYSTPGSPHGSGVGVSAALLSNKPTGPCVTSFIAPPAPAPSASR